MVQTVRTKQNNMDCQFRATMWFISPDLRHVPEALGKYDDFTSNF